MGVCVLVYDGDGVGMYGGYFGKDGIGWVGEEGFGD